MIRTTADMQVSDKVRSTVDAMPGEIIDVDYANVKIRWEDDSISNFRKQDGFVGFVPRYIK